MEQTFMDEKWQNKIKTVSFRQLSLQSVKCVCVFAGETTSLR